MWGGSSCSLAVGSTPYTLDSLIPCTILSYGHGLLSAREGDPEIDGMEKWEKFRGACGVVCVCLVCVSVCKAERPCWKGKKGLNHVWALSRNLDFYPVSNRRGPERRMPWSDLHCGMSTGQSKEDGLEGRQSQRAAELAEPPRRCLDESGDGHRWLSRSSGCIIWTVPQELC